VVEIGTGPAPVGRGIGRACAWPKPGGADNHGMSPHFKILYLFVSAHGWLAEVKRLHMAAGAPKDQVYQWAWISTAQVVPLRFVSMAATEPRQQREFEEASLWFDTRRGALAWHGGATVALEVQADNALPSPQEQLLQAHFSMA